MTSGDHRHACGALHGASSPDWLFPFFVVLLPVFFLLAKALGLVAGAAPKVPVFLALGALVELDYGVEAGRFPKR